MITHSSLGSTNLPGVAAWPGNTPRGVVGYQCQSATGQDIWLAYYVNGAKTLSIPPYLFWLDDFPGAAYGFWSNAAPTGVIAGPILQMAYSGVSDTPGDQPQIYGRTWSPILSPPDQVAIDGPDTGLVGSPYACIAMTSPITYLWQATGQSPVVHVGGFSDSMSFVWDTPGAKTITVTATNVAGSVLHTYAVDIGLRDLFLPIVMRP